MFVEDACVGWEIRFVDERMRPDAMVKTAMGGPNGAIDRPRFDHRGPVSPRRA